MPFVTIQWTRKFEKLRGKISPWVEIPMNWKMGIVFCIDNPKRFLTTRLKISNFKTCSYKCAWILVCERLFFIWTCCTSTLYKKPYKHQKKLTKVWLSFWSLVGIFPRKRWNNKFWLSFCPQLWDFSPKHIETINTRMETLSQRNC